ncbi:hypothetical protein [Enterococcus timonensis]|uniref:hypothetical protein n=1 Tax=Enterococcus timonensis TaxID=1852364 RepID=UPI0008D9F150|nr:hypothetical protein [Enterococcus timonensis]
MKTNEIVSVFVSFAQSSSGKRRPILVIEDVDNEVQFFSITSKFEQKSNRIKKQYFYIEDWESVGLKKKSWIDIGTVLVLKKNLDVEFKKIGSLSDISILKLASFVQSFNEKENKQQED